MARTLNKSKNRRFEGTYTLIPHAVQDSPNWINASPNAIKLLLAIVRKFNGKNNGDLSATFSQMKRLGWSSQSTLDWGLKELQHYGLIEKTRQGDLTKKPSLYAVTWLPIDYLGQKLELCAPSHVPSGKWKQQVPMFDRKAVVQTLPRRKK